MTARLIRSIALLLVLLALQGLAARPALAGGPSARPASAPAAQVPPGEDWDIPGGHFFSQTRGQAPSAFGYVVLDDAVAPFWSEFRRLGGVSTVGYPVSRRFQWDGFVVQAFQKVVFQWRPELGRVAFVNVFDELSRQGKDEWLATARAVPRPAELDEAGLSFQQVVEARQRFLDPYPEIQAAFYSAGDWMSFNGLPVAPVAEYENVRVLRAQRVIIQQWLVGTPWAAAGQVVFANGGDVAKEAGLIPPAAAEPEDSSAFLRSASGSPVLPPTDEATHRLRVPSGFAIRIFADGLSGRARFMAFGPDGMLYLTLMDAGQIVRLPDRNNDGVADRVEVIADNLYLPHGIEWHDGWLYVAEGNRIERLRAHDGRFEIRELVTNNIPDKSVHFTRTLHFGPDGKLYVSVGSSCNACTEDDPRRAAMLRFNPDGTIPPDNPWVSDPDPRRHAVWAWGLRNSVDFLWTPDGQLWANHNGSDALSDDLPPEAIVLPVQGGRHYGWPTCFTPGLGPNLSPMLRAPVQDPRFVQFGVFDCSSIPPALFTDLAHSAPLGMSLARGSGFPDEFRSDLFVAYHGSWNTAPEHARDCKVERVVIRNGMPLSSEPFVAGWRAPGKMCGDATTWGRPADVRFGPDGAMYISDDFGKRVYRVVYVGH